ncbi:MAG: archaeal heat shock protein Hsp20 [Candidatus Bathyarchaeia archaeon]
MSSWDDWFKRFLRRRSFLFPDIERMIEEMEREMAKSFKEMEDMIPKDMVRDRRLSDGRKSREYGPFVYGYSIRIGPDGKPKIRTFGNFKPGYDEGEVDLSERREPLIDIIEEDDKLTVIAELPGVDKNDIKLYATDDTLTIDVDTPQRKYRKDVELPAEVEETTAKSKYKNGILETVFEKKKKSRGKSLDIE